MLLTVYSILVAIFWLFLTPWLIINGRRIKYLSSIKVFENRSFPSVVIIIPVRNEEYALREALTSVCELDYEDYKVVVVNDRSSDGSGKILEEVRLLYKNLSVITIETLPQHWLGKNHALYTGAEQTTGDYILFTDADVVFKKNTLRKAIGYTLDNDLDHLTILPGILTSSPVLKSVLLTFVIILSAFKRPWAAKRKTSDASMGVGAFNLVKREIYNRAGTHKAIAMRPDDDLELAAAIKASGGSADVLYGIEEIELEWYTNVKGFIHGLMKNIFSGFKYNAIFAVGGALGILMSFVLPLPVMMIFGNNFERILAIIVLLAQLILYAKMPGAGGKMSYGILCFYAGLIIVYVIIRATIINLSNGGIYWRETFYPLSELRKHK